MFCSCGILVALFVVRNKVRKLLQRPRSPRASGTQAPGRLAVFAATTSLTACPAALIAQNADTHLADASLADLLSIPVYSASRSSQPLSEAPASVIVVSREQIMRAGYRTLADALRGVRGLYLSSDLQYTYVGVRGYSEPGNYNTRILLMIDGHRVNDVVYEQATVGSEFILDVDLIDHIEVVLGPSSSLYGTNAVFAVVNVFTRSAQTFHGVELSTETGSWNTYRSRVSYGGRFAGIDSIASATFSHSKGQKYFYFSDLDNPTTNNGMASHVDGDAFAQGFLKLSGRGMQLEAGYSTREKADPTAAWGDIFNDPENRARDTKRYVDLRYEHKLSASSLMARAYFNGSHSRGTYPYTDESGQRVVNEDLSQGNNAGMEVQATTNLRSRYQVVTGFEFRNDYLQHQTNFDIKPKRILLETNNPSYIAAPYFEAKLPLLRNLTLIPSVRTDYNPRTGWMVSQRAALTYRPLERTIAKVIYGSSFRTPNAYELFYYGTKGSLRPERLTAWEVDLDHSFNAHLSATIALYRNLLHDFITDSSDTDASAPYSNEARQSTAGAELQVDATLDNGFRISAVYGNTFQREDVERGRLENSPKDTGKLYASLPLFSGRAFATLTGQYMGRRITLAKDVVPSYSVFNATLLMHTPARSLDLTATLNNALNKTYYDPGAQQHPQQQIPQRGRSFLVRLVWNPGGGR